MSTAITNAKIYRGNGRFAEAMLIDGGKITAVGSETEIFAKPHGESIDLGGRTVVPGFNDSHMHLYSIGERAQSIDLKGTTSIEEIGQRTAEFISRGLVPEGTPISGGGWNQDFFVGEHRLPTRYDLDRFCPDRPLILSRTCGHMLVANSAAIRLAGVDKHTPQPAGAAFDVDESGEPTGIFREEAANLVTRVLPGPTPESAASALKIAMAHAAEWGVTSVQTMDLVEDSWRDMLGIYGALQLDNPTLRVYHQCNLMSIDSLREFMAEKPFRYGTDFNRIGPIKLFVDGSLGSRTALLRHPYADDPSTCGIATLTEQQLFELVSAADENGYQVAIHCIGDAAIERVLDCYERVSAPGNPLRHGIIHCQLTDRPLLERFRRQNVLAYVQPIFLDYDVTVVRERVGEQLAESSYAFETLRKSGVSVSLGTDSPVEDLNPIANISCAVTRQRLSGGEPYIPAEAMTVQNAIDCYTAGSAYAQFEEGVKGLLEPGYFADLAVLSEDIFSAKPQDIKNISVDATMVDGRIVFSRL